MKKLKSYYGSFGGQFVPETLYKPLKELERAFGDAAKSAAFKKDLSRLLADYAGRPTPLYYAERLSSFHGRRIYLKREDLNHTGSHKINNALGQILLARRMGKKRIIAETGAGQHGVAVATAAALFGMKCVVYMGTVDMERQAVNVARMKLLGTEVVPVVNGDATLKEAVSEAIRDWISDPSGTYYIIGSCVGPHPYPLMVRFFQSVIGDETKRQIRQKENRLPDYLVACVGGGSNSIGFFHPFYKSSVKFIGVEAGGMGGSPENTAASICYGSPGVLHGAYSYLLQSREGQILETHSVAAGLDYPSVGPEHSFYHQSGRAEYVSVSDRDALKAFERLSTLEGIIPALESSHALAYLSRLAPKTKKNALICVCLSGRGDKDMAIEGSLARGLKK
ncbi:MAG: tryptophan synthase subunit beta [Elusimicrobia bacterium CG03_land_8_20_14_0_80_50_18]|nr:MAG: tryptophan synthase subunit beta [Elusimicrobia bacterium CG03_land_8_20_14_0_80_50_18]